MKTESIISKINLEQISLVVRDRDSMIRFYTERLGMTHLHSSGTSNLLGFGHDEAVLELLEDNTAMSRPAHAPGLFHVAYLYPDRRSLASALHRLSTGGWPIHGAADHGVSEAIYLADPEGNGIELYVDRPRDQWTVRDGMIEMVTEPLDLQDLLSEVDGNGSDRVGTRIGHIHLQVSSLPEAEAYWCAGIGLEVTQRSFPGALFASAGGYHHHIGLNVWRSKGATLPEGIFTGLRSLKLSVPIETEFDALNGRLEGGIDPESHKISTTYESTIVHIHTHQPLHF